MNSEQYWQKRTRERLVESEKTGLEIIAQIEAIYKYAISRLDKDIKSLYTNYSKKGVLDASELKRALTPSERTKFLRAIARAARRLGVSVEDLLDMRYLARLTRLEALKNQIELEIASTAPKQVSAATKSYSEMVKSNYEALMKDSAKLLGADVTFSTLDKRVVDQILRSRWFKGNYSSRIWKNVTNFSKELPEIIGSGITSGQSYAKTAKILRDRFEVARSDAIRLVRTENNYLYNQSELQGYIDDGYTEYKYDAVMDKRTSSICKSLENDVFKVIDAQVGKNYPPMHPRCRSTTQIIISSRGKPLENHNTKRLLVGKTNKEIQSNYVDNMGK
jgi:SPP1 gp7 family putative phage head morphogenesis protein